MPRHERQHRVHRRMPKAAAWIWLDRHAGADDGPRLAKHSDDTVGIEAAAGHLEETPGTIERISTRGKSLAREFRRGHTVERGSPDVQRLRHRPEADANAGG